jgi:hypothetical protein
MAEIPIEALIREAAQSRGVDPDLALKIAQKESDLYPKAKNKRSSAYGLFQITDPTWKQYGGTDENRYDLMDNIRIGVDIIASNRDRFLREFKRAPNAGELYTMHVFGQTGGPRIMRQDPNALMADVVSPQVVKANKIPKTQTVGEFIGMLQKKMGSKLDTQMAKRRVKEQTSGTVPMPAAPKETLRETREPVTPISTNRIPAQRGERLQPLAQVPEEEDRIGVVTKDVLEKLGPNYQAALAAMTLGDTREDDDDDEDSLSEQFASRQEEEQRRAEVPRSAALAGLDLSYQSPFGEEQPVMMAKGGIVHRANGSPMYGEGVPDSGPVTADTRRALSLPQGLSAAELMRMLKSVGAEGVSNLESIARGSVAAVPGLVGDVESLFRSDKERKFATTPEVERQYLPSRITKPTAQSEGFTEAGTFIDPTIAGKVAKPVAKGTAKAALAGFKSVSPQLENILEKSAFGLDKMYVVKPTGGTTYPASMVSKIDDYLQRIQRGVTRPTIFGIDELKGKDAKKIIEFVGSKGRDYLTKRYGSPQDEMKEAILDGRVTLTGADAELFPPKLLAQAREGNPVALERYEEIYDKSTGLRGTVVIDNLADTTTTSAARQKEWDKLLKEGALPHEINLNILPSLRKDLGYGHGSDAETALRRFLSGEQIPPKEASGVMYAARHGEPIYDMDSMYPRLEYLDPDTVIPALASVVNDLDRMSFPEALVRGMKKTEVLRNDEAAIERAAQGKNVPLELFQRGIEPIAPIGDFSLVRVKSPFAVRMEGAAMRHSIGNYALDPQYGLGGKKAFESGDTQVFSIRNVEGKPIVSMDAEMDYDIDAFYGHPKIDQIRAVFNSEPNEQEKQVVFKAFDALYPNLDSSDLAKFLPVVKYKNTREGLTLPVEDRTEIDWWQEYTNYLRKQDAS